MTKFTWTDERVTLLRGAAAGAWGASAIAHMLGHGCTRNAVISKCRRLGVQLQGRSMGKSGVRYVSEEQVRALEQVAQAAPATSRPLLPKPGNVPFVPRMRVGDRVTGKGLPGGSAVIVAVRPAPPGSVELGDLGPYNCPAIVAGEPTEAETVRYCGCVRAPGKRWCVEHHRRYTGPGAAAWGSRPFEPRAKRTGFAIRHGR